MTSHYKFNYLTDADSNGNGESPPSSSRQTGQKEFSPALDGEIRPPNQLR